MNILLVSNMFPPIATGSSHYTSDLAQSLTEAGHSVAVLTVSLSKETASSDDDLPYDVIRLPALHFNIKGLFKWFSVVCLNPLNYYRYARIIKKRKIQIVHQVNHYLDTAILTRFVCGIVKIPYVISIHTQLVGSSKFSSWIIRLLDRLICGKIILHAAARIIALDSEVVRYLKETHASHIIDNKQIIIPHGIDILKSSFKPKGSYELKNLIVSIGHVAKIRNRINLIKAMKGVVQQFPDVRLEIIGHMFIEEPVMLVRKLRLERNVFFRGELPYEDTILRLKDADCNVVWLDSKYHGAGTAVSESMLCGVPVVNNSPKNLLGEGAFIPLNNIVLVDSNNPEEIADQIILLLSSEKLRRKIGQNSVNFIHEQMDLKVIREKLIRLYSSVIGD